MARSQYKNQVLYAADCSNFTGVKNAFSIELYLNRGDLSTVISTRWGCCPRSFLAELGRPWCILTLLAAVAAARPMIVLLVFLALVPVAQAQLQPLPFSHVAHIEKARMQCTDCHEGAVERDTAGIPSIRKCMLCHQFIATDHPAVMRLSEYWERGHEVPWVRVYAFEEGAMVQFRHAPHGRVGVECVECHGEVATMTEAVRAVRHTMGSCIECHRERSATDDCLACHF